jgi:hypothetical protein
VAFATLRDGQNLNFALPASHVRDLLQKAQDVRPLAALGSGRKAQTNFLERAQGSVRAVNFGWKGGQLDWYYTFVLRNLGDDGVKDIAYVLIFYGKDSLPVHSEIAIYKPAIMGHLAKIVESGSLSGQSAPWVSPEVRKQSNKVEVRVLNYQIVR